MTGSGLKQKAVSGVLWSFVDTFAGQGIAFVIGVILARLLSPSDYGLIGMLAIFMAVAQTFINSGFGSALIQKADRTETDYATVFYFNFAVGALFYLLLYFASPWIAEFYKTPLLEPLSKALAFNFVISALSFVHRTKLTIEMNFRTQTLISIVSVIVSGAAGILLAYGGFGVWALVVQSILNAACQSALYWYAVKWKPLLVFSRASFRRLFGFGSKLLASGLIDTVYNNIYSVVIGRVFSAADLGYYTRAQQLAMLPASSITGVLGKVTFPIFCTMQDDAARLIAAYRKMIRLTSFLTMPLMLALASVAAPLVLLLFTEKWAGTIGLFRILCFMGIWYPLHVINLNILQAIGRSDLFLRLEIIKKCWGAFILAATIPFGLVVIVAGQAFYSFACLFINAYYTGKYFDYGIVKQLRDVAPFLAAALGIGAVDVAVIDAFDTNLAKVAAGSAFYGASYLIVSAVMKFGELDEVIGMMKNFPLRKPALAPGFDPK